MPAIRRALRNRDSASSSSSRLRASVKWTGRPTITRSGSGPIDTVAAASSFCRIRPTSVSSVRCRPPTIVPVKLASPRYAFSDWMKRPFCADSR
jgi:hypothetical protein